MLSFLTIFSWHRFQKAQGHFSVDSGDLLSGKFQNWLRFGEWVGVAVAEIWRQEEQGKPQRRSHCEESKASRLFQQPWAFHGEGLRSGEYVAAADTHSWLSFTTTVSCLEDNSQAYECELKDLLLSYPFLGHFWGLCRSLGCQRHCRAHSSTGTRMEVMKARPLITHSNLIFSFSTGFWKQA